MSNGNLPLIPKAKSKERRIAIGTVNLHRAHERSTPEQRKFNAMVAGIASSKARYERKSFRETVLAICETPIGQELLEAMGFNEGQAAKLAGKVTNLTLATIAVMQRAHEGNLEAFKTIRDTAGEMPTQKIEQNNIGPPPSLTVNFGGDE